MGASRNRKWQPSYDEADGDDADGDDADSLTSGHLPEICPLVTKPAEQKSASMEEN